MSGSTHCLTTGQKIGSYEVVRPLGEGAMGEVYEVFDSKLDRHAALKVVPPWLAQDKTMLARFRREVRATCRVRHSGVVHIFDYGVLPDQGSPYFVMEYLDGETFHTRLWRASKQPGGRLGISAVPILRQIALALAAVHRQGLVHRDLKPANVMLVPDSTGHDGERIKLLDFGIVKILQGDEPSPGDSQDGVTRQGAILGTPRYMAPEQWLCKAVDDKADVYAMGVMTYLALSGRLPFVAPDGPALGMLHCYKKAPSLDRVASDLPRELVELVAQMLEKSPAKRPAMVEVAETLGAFMPKVSVASAAADSSSDAEFKETQSEIFIEADYEQADTLSQHGPVEFHSLDLTQRLLPIAQRSTLLLHPVAEAPPASPTIVPRATLLTSVVHENTDSMLVGSSDNFKIEKGNSSWLAMGLAAALLICSSYFTFGMRPASVERMNAVQAVALPPTPALVVAPALPAMPAPLPALIPLNDLRADCKPASVHSEHAPSTHKHRARHHHHRERQLQAEQKAEEKAEVKAEVKAEEKID